MIDKCLPEKESRAAVLVALIMNGMSSADGFPSLEKASGLNPGLVDIYARYAAIAVDVIEKYENNPMQVVVSNEEGKATEG